mgnify:CR=1 FL=1
MFFSAPIVNGSCAGVFGTTLYFAPLHLTEKSNRPKGNYFFSHLKFILLKGNDIDKGDA